ncbi:MAG TPA: polysaccharide biosynthesis tyrosine autokinase [Vicinamibacterales bacterium]|jgi:capsular exopolysaccharide synthesis family protein
MGRVTDALTRAGATDGKASSLGAADVAESFPSETPESLPEVTAPPAAEAADLATASRAAVAAPVHVDGVQPPRVITPPPHQGLHVVQSTPAVAARPSAQTPSAAPPSRSRANLPPAAAAPAGDSRADASGAQPAPGLVAAGSQQGTHRDPLLEWESSSRSAGSNGTRGGELALFRGFKKSIIEKLTVENGASGGIVEEYRKLAATLHHAQSVHGLKTVMVSSAAAGEGKTLTSVNLALTLSESYRRNVLLIDCDLRKPSVHDVFDLKNTAGMIHVLSHGHAQKVPLVEVSPRLKLLLSGGVASDPMGLLSSKTLHNLLQDAAESFDWVIIDTPPAAFLPDCNLLASIVDAALLVVRAFDTPYQLTQRAVEAIGREKILGVVMNRAERPATAKYYYGYYNYT